MTEHLYLLDAGRMERESPLHPYTVGRDPSHRETGPCATFPQPHHRPLEDLCPLPIPLHDAYIDPYRIPRPYLRQILPELFFFYRSD